MYVVVVHAVAETRIGSVVVAVQPAFNVLGVDDDDALSFGSNDDEERHRAPNIVMIESSYSFSFFLSEVSTKFPLSIHPPTHPHTTHTHTYTAHTRTHTHHTPISSVSTDATIRCTH